MRKPRQWRVRDKNRILLAVMKDLAGDALISFEGDFKNLRLQALAGASGEETPALRRNTLWPKQDFIIVPLELSAIPSINAAMGGTIPQAIDHIQIAKAGVLEFGAYDNFHPHAMAFGVGMSESFIESLYVEGLLERLND